jgi:hypothetical protein
MRHAIKRPASTIALPAMSSHSSNGDPVNHDRPAARRYLGLCPIRLHQDRGGLVNFIVAGQQEIFAAMQRRSARQHDGAFGAYAKTVRQDDARTFGRLRGAAALYFRFQRPPDLLAVRGALQAFPADQDRLGATRAKGDEG